VHRVHRIHSVNDAIGVTDRNREKFLLFEAGNSRDKQLRLLLSMSTVEVQLDPVYTETLTPERFLELYKKGLLDIKSVYVVPPKLGSFGFGKIVVRRKTPIYTSKHELPDKDE
jgi:hypothetical protein